ncbi:MAG: DUF3144 domain-containing protein [Haliea sp.]|jgi:ribosomal protein L32E|nr:DUF3144 domain-containing protein [Haliea sp.]MDP4788588.1 DUF3144 domain-containing protein [Haliea sp.]MDP4917381.1 DUF3144 domain-containing protein [Haliea sp.]MDP5063836.1 DUF3144 domain-containing protein [Haliea sp.]
MSADDAENHQQCMERFVALANTMKDEGMSTRVVSAALMTASGVYATYTVAGNSGGLHPSGVEKVAAAYKENLENIQRLKQAESAAGQSNA